MKMPFSNVSGSRSEPESGQVLETDISGGASDTSDMVKTRATFYLATLYVIIYVVGLTANAAVLYTITRSRRSKVITNIFIFNLAVADLLYVVCLPAAVYQMLNGQWTFGHIMCKLYFTCDGVSKFASVMFLVVLSLDRYIAVCHPIRFRSVRTTKFAFGTTAFAWIIVIVGMIPIFLHATLLRVTREGGSDTYQCVIYWPQPSSPTGVESVSTDIDYRLSMNSSFHFSNFTSSYKSSGELLEAEDNGGAALEIHWSRRIFTLYMFTLSFLAPLAMVWIFYTMILLRLRAQKKRLFNSNVPAEKPVTDGEQTTTDGDDERTTWFRQKRSQSNAATVPANQRRSRSTRRVTIMVLSIVICYTVCWIPFWCVQLTIEFFPTLIQTVFELEVFTVVSYIAYGMQSVNSMLNPFLYAFGTQIHRRRFLMKCDRCMGIVGCSWRVFRIGSPPPRFQTCTTSRCRSERSGCWEENGIDSYVPSRRSQNTFQTDDRSLPYLGYRLSISQPASRREGEASTGFLSGGQNPGRSYGDEPFFGYCLCCYCGKPDDSTMKSPGE